MGTGNSEPIRDDFPLRMELKGAERELHSQIEHLLVGWSGIQLPLSGNFLLENYPFSLYSIEPKGIVSYCPWRWEHVGEYEASQPSETQGLDLALLSLKFPAGRM